MVSVTNHEGMVERVETIHAPLPSAAAYWLNRAVAMTAPLTSRVG
jgi:hypothetical protein